MYIYVYFFNYIRIYMHYPFGVLGEEECDPGQPDPPDSLEARSPSVVALFFLWVSHKYIHIYI